VANRYTDEQQAAIDTHGCDLLVSAAAGSGKTAVLIERLIQMITDTKKPVELDRLLVVTFTDAAAQEMRQRLGDALRRRLKDDPSDVHMQRQMLLLPKASITTIHSFCLQIVRSHFAQLGIDPSFRVADVTETELLKLEVMRGLFERLYEDDADEDGLDVLAFGEGGKADFHRLVEFYGDAVKDDALQGLAMSLYEFSRSKPWPEAWLEEQAESFCAESVAEMEQSAWYAFFKQEAGDELAALAAELAEAAALAQNPNIHVGYVELLNDELNMVCLASRELGNGLDAFIRAMADSAFGRLPGAQSKTKDGTMTEEAIKALKETIQDIRNDVKDRFGDLKKKAAFKPADDMLADMNSLYGVMRTLAGVVNAFAEKFGQEKRRRNIVDFSDFEHLCLEVLLEDGSTEENPIPSAAAMALQEKYAEICVDEYQDSNLVQELILLSVSRKGQGTPNRFMVGDMKQSIYRFRMANPELFRQKYLTYSREAGVGIRERVIGLSKNFRSRDGVLDCINLLFRQTMDEALGDVVYDENAMLYFGAEYYPAYRREEDRAAEVILVETAESESETAADSEAEEGDSTSVFAELTGAEAEARAVAERIDEMINGSDPFHVSTKEGSFRPAEYRDIVILLRSPGVLGGAYAEELRRLGIPSFAGSTKGYFEATEVLTVLGLLQTIDNPRQDLHLITVLHSPLYGFTADELVAIRACSDGLFYDAVLAAVSSEMVGNGVRGRLAAFCTQLNDWRDRAVMTPVSAMLWALYEETGYYRLVGTMAGGHVRCANLTALFERAVQYERTSLKGLFHFIRYIERLQKSGQELSEAKVLGENENVVRIMSVHKSKGLEFPIVFVCGLGRQFNMMDTRASFVMHSELGFGPKHIDLESRVASDTLKRYAVNLRIRRENLSEELRLLYVALTRAKEKLILTAAVKSAAAEGAKLARSARTEALMLPNAVRLRAGRFVDWILPSLARHRDVSGLTGGAENACTAVWQDVSRWRLSIVSKAASERAAMEENASFRERLAALNGLDMQADYSGQREAVWQRLAYQYETMHADEIPSKMSVSEIKRLHYAGALADSASLFDNMPAQEELPAWANDSGGAEGEKAANEAVSDGERRKSNLRVPRMVSGDTSPDAARRGTLLHTVLEHIDFARDVTAEAVDALIADLVRRGFMRGDETQFVDRRAILAFMQSDIAARIRRSDDVRREVRFTSGEKPHDINAEWDAAIASRIVVHGVIDLMFREGDGFVLVDYKTDRFAANPEALEAVMDRYRPQLRLYRRAIQKFTGKTVSESVLYFFNRQIAKTVEE